VQAIGLWSAPPPCLLKARGTSLSTTAALCGCGGPPRPHTTSGSSGLPEWLLSEEVGVTGAQMDGNALMLSRFNRHATVSESEFAWIGGTAIAAWGWTDELSNNGTRGYDATAGEFPRHTSITRNTIREVGIFEKQSSGLQRQLCAAGIGIIRT
jgi:hypothetical protein